RHGGDLLGRSDAVVEMEAGVPHRVPQRLGHAGDGCPPVVQEHEVEVARRAQLGPAVAADGEQGDAVAVPTVEGNGEYCTDPLVHRLGVGAGERPSLEAGGEKARTHCPEVDGAHADLRRRHSYRASAPTSPVRTRMARPTSTAQILPSPILPVRPVVAMISITLSTSADS